MSGKKIMYEQTDVLDDWVEHFRGFSTKGQCASYIPALKNANPYQLGICVIGPDGQMKKSGDWQSTFTLQSISKTISFISACMDFGIDYVLERVDVEPTGDAFNSIIRLEMNNSGKPFNPMINAGALTVSSLLGERTPNEKIDSICSLISRIIGKNPSVNEEVFLSEWNHSHRNRSIAHYLKETGYLESSVDETLEVYLKQCSIEVNSEDLAMIGLVLAQDGYQPFKQKQIFSKEVARLTKALMVTCGMYNASGKYAAFIGVPAKSGVSGGIMGAAAARDRLESTHFQNGCGIGIYGPAIDEYGNSVAGAMLLKKISEEWDLNIF